MTIPDDQFWRPGASMRPPLTDEMLAAAEERLGVRLPAELVRLLRLQNGGNTDGFRLPMTTPTTWAEDHIPLYELFGIVTDPSVGTGQNLLDTEYLTDEWDLPPGQVLLAGDGHGWVTLDYRRRAEPSVAWIDVDNGQDLQVAPTFAAFLDRLVPDSPAGVG